MSPELEAKFGVLNDRMEAMISRVEGYAPEVKNSAVGNSFSPDQVIEHMAIVEGLYANYIAKAVSSGVPSGKSKPNFLLGFVIKRMQKPKVNSPAIKSVKPTGDGSVATQATRWKATRAIVLAHYAKYDDDQTCLKHSLFGTMSPADIHSLLSTHQDYHEARLP